MPDSATEITGHSATGFTGFASGAIDRGLGCRVLRAVVRPYPGRVTAAATVLCQIRTYGCQMNVHDSERLAGLLDEAGYQPAG